MRDKQSRRLFTAILCIIISIFGLIFTFGSGNGEEEENEEKNSRREGKNYEYVQEELPQDENESQDETYTDGKRIMVYFTNTEKLDESSLPLAVHAILCQEAQKHLEAGGFENARGLRILDDRFSDSKDAISFQCEIAGYEEMLEVTYKKGERKLKFETVETERIGKK